MAWCSSHILNFEPTESPAWRSIELPPTSEMLRQIQAWARQLQGLPEAATAFVGKFCQSAAAQFIYQANVSEGTGLSDLDDTISVLEGSCAGFTDKRRREVLQLQEAMDELTRISSQMKQAVGSRTPPTDEHSRPTLVLIDGTRGTTGRPYDVLTLTPDVICWLHKCMMKNLHPDAGRFRKSFTYGGTPAGGLYFYQPPDLIENILLTICDWYNATLYSMPGDAVEAVPLLYRVASVLFLMFETCHPFGDGNGRLGRLLASHVLRLVTPFPITARADCSTPEEDRKIYLQALTSARSTDANTFLKLNPPKDLAALFVEGAWRTFSDLFENLEMLGLLSTQKQRGFFRLSHICPQTAYNQLVDIGLSDAEKKEELQVVLRAVAAMNADPCVHAMEVQLKLDSVCKVVRF